MSNNKFKLRLYNFQLLNIYLKKDVLFQIIQSKSLKLLEKSNTKYYLEKDFKKSEIDIEKYYQKIRKLQVNKMNFD